MSLFPLLASFSAEDINQWTDDGSTALCPNCGVDAVLSSNADDLSDKLIEQLHATYFGSVKKIFCRRMATCADREKERQRRKAIEVRMKIATWNVNSIRQREKHVASWLERCQPDVLLLQEIKCEAPAFPALDLSRARLPVRSGGPEGV